jgi:hypothetical protein
VTIIMIIDTIVPVAFSSIKLWSRRLKKQFGPGNANCALRLSNSTCISIAGEVAIFHPCDSLLILLHHIPVLLFARAINHFIAILGVLVAAVTIIALPTRSTSAPRSIVLRRPHGLASGIKVRPMSHASTIIIQIGHRSRSPWDSSSSSSSSSSMITSLIAANIIRTIASTITKVKHDAALIHPRRTARRRIVGPVRHAAIVIAHGCPGIIYGAVLIGGTARCGISFDLNSPLLLLTL